MTETLDQSEEERIAERIVRNQLEQKRLQEENDTLKAFLKQSPDAYPAGMTREVGKFYIRVTSNTRIDDKLAQEKLTPTEYRAASKTVIDPVKAKRVLKPARIAEITKTYENRIEVGLR